MSRRGVCHKVSSGPPTAKPIVVVCLDGISWDYLKYSDSSFIDGLRREGAVATCSAMVPTVTNVNNASIITGAFPDEHGISSNSYFDPESLREVYMDSSDFLTCQTILGREATAGGRTLLLTVKDKLRRLLARDVTESYSTERPPARVVSELGSPPSIYSLESSPWLLSAAEHEIRKGSWSMVYVSTTDYVPHLYAPRTTEAKEYMRLLNEGLERIAELEVVLGVVADHGMNPKKIRIDLTGLLRENGVEARFVAAIRDEHFVHHSNLGGSAYLYVKENLEKAVDLLSSAEGVEAVFTRAEAASRFRLPARRIGDILVLAGKEYTFGANGREIYSDVAVRSHGSLHEMEVPFITNLKVEVDRGIYNKDMIPVLTRSR